MTEAQLKCFPAFQKLPVYDERDERSNMITTVAAAKAFRSIRECSTLQEVEECLRDQRFVPLGALRAANDDGPIAFAYFGERL